MGAIGRSGAAGQFKRSSRTRPPRRVFISYSHADFQHCNRLAQVLRPLCEAPGDEVWLDSSRLKAGDLWREEIATALEEAQYFVLLLSQDYRASDVCMNFELARILARERSQPGVRIIGVPVHQVALDLFSCTLDDGSVHRLGERHCVPQSDRDVGGVRRKDLVPITDRSWADTRDAWTRVQRDLQEAFEKEEAGDRETPSAGRWGGASPGLPPAPADFPALAPPYLCDRQDPADLLAMTLADWHAQHCQRPLLVLTEGDEQDCLSEWVDRVSTFEVPQALPLFDGGELAFGDPGVFDLPGGGRDEAEARRRLTLQFAKLLGRNVGTPLAQLQAEVVARRQPTFWWTELHLSDGVEHLLPGLRALVDVLANWPDLAVQGPLVVAVNLVLDGAAGSSQALWAGLHAVLRPTGVVVAELGRLPRVQKKDLTVWAKRPHVQPRLPRRNIDTLRDRLTEPKPMRDFARLYDDWAAHG